MLYSVFWERGWFSCTVKKKVLVFSVPTVLLLCCRSWEMRCSLCLVLVCVAVLLPSGLCQDSCRVQDGKPGEKGVPGRDGLTGQKGEKGEPSMCELLWFQNINTLLYNQYYHRW